MSDEIDCGFKEVVSVVRILDGRQKGLSSHGAFGFESVVVEKTSGQSRLADLDGSSVDILPAQFHSSDTGPQARAVFR